MRTLPSTLLTMVIGFVLGVVVTSGAAFIDLHQRDVEHSRSLDALVQTADEQHTAELARINALQGELATARRAADDAGERLARAAEASRAARVRASRSRRLSPAVVHTVDNPDPVPAGAAAWAAGSFARAVADCESGGNPRSVSGSGKYRGKWQMDADFWRSYGGLQYASTPDQATEAEQDAVAYRGWQARGWQPWSCARIVRSR